VAIELHPAVYVSFIALNLCVVFAYREFIQDPHQQISASAASATSSMNVSHSLGESGTGLSSPLALAEKEQPSIKALGDQSEAVSHTHQLSASKSSLCSDESLEASSKLVPDAKPLACRSTPSTAGAALASVPQKSTLGPHPKKAKRLRSGLIPPPPPGVMVVPPPPDAPPLISAGSHGKFGFLVPPPPPMVFDSPSFETFGQTGYRKKSPHEISGEFKNNNRARMVHRGEYKQVIVSR
jgi:hypothetical protein